MYRIFEQQQQQLLYQIWSGCSGIWTHMRNNSPLSGSAGTTP